jgi:hypothetical protein
MALKQLCNFQKVFSGKISRIILLYAILTIGFRIVTNLSFSAIKVSEIFAFCVATFFTISPYQWISFLSGDYRPVCDFVPTVTLFSNIR